MGCEGIAGRGQNFEHKSLSDNANAEMKTKSKASSTKQLHLPIRLYTDRLKIDLILMPELYQHPTNYNDFTFEP